MIPWSPMYVYLFVMINDSVVLFMFNDMSIMLITYYSHLVLDSL